MRRTDEGKVMSLRLILHWFPLFEAGQELTLLSLLLYLAAKIFAQTQQWKEIVLFFFF